jgi:hypothetical protein
MQAIDRMDDSLQGCGLAVVAGDLFDLMQGDHAEESAIGFGEEGPMPWRRMGPSMSSATLMLPGTRKAVVVVDLPDAQGCRGFPSHTFA